MDLKGFAYYKWIGMSKILMKHAPFRKQYPNVGLVSTRMAYDSISPSSYDGEHIDKEGFEIDYPRYRTLELLAMEISRKKIQGSIAELGVFRGDFSAIMNRVFPNSKHYLFDTFEGFSEIDSNYELEKGYSSKHILESYKNTSVEIVLSKMAHPENCIVKKGYFPDSLDGLEDRFSFVSLDCDLYAPIRAGIEYFYPRLNDGGYIMIHDYRTIEHRGCKEAVYDYEKEYGQIPIVPIADAKGTLILTK